MPLKALDVDSSISFTADELLYRRVSPEGFNSKMELLPSELETFSFDKEMEGAPSVNRGLFSSPEDVLHIDCAQKLLEGWFVYCLTVGSLPQGLAAGDGKLFDFKPVHIPKELCGAHSVISSYLKADPEQTYRMPTRPVKNALRTQLVSILSPCGAVRVAQPQAAPIEPEGH